VVSASELYEEDEYISDYEPFRKLVRKERNNDGENE
jgi:hypothetical protein